MRQYQKPTGITCPLGRFPLILETELMLKKSSFGIMASQICGLKLPLEVLSSHAGFYIGTSTEIGSCSRESVEYWATDTKAYEALKNHIWTQRLHP